MAQNKQSELADSTGAVGEEALREVLKSVRSEAGPQTPEEKENYFMTQIGMGEQLTLQGQSTYSLLLVYDALTFSCRSSILPPRCNCLLPCPPGVPIAC